MNIDEDKGSHNNRKARLVLAGAIYRAGLVTGYVCVMESVYSKSLIQRALEQIINNASARLERVLTPVNGRIPALISFAMTVFTKLPNKKVRTLGLGVGLVAALTVMLLGFYSSNTGRSPP